MSKAALAATARLNTMNVLAGYPAMRLPWTLAYLSARAIQRPASEIWRGADPDAPAAQSALAARAICHRIASPGEYAASREAA